MLIPRYKRQVYALITHRFFTRPPVKGFNAPLPLDAGNEILFCGLRLSCFLVWLLSLFPFFEEEDEGLVAVAPSTSMSASIMRLLAHDSSHH